MYRCTPGTLLQLVRFLMRRKSFTLTELLVVIVILGIVAGFALPQYQKMIDRNYEKQGRNNLLMIYAAEKAYEAEHGEVWPTDSSTYYIGDINANLRLNIIEEGLTYSCTSSSTTEFDCVAALGTKFVLRVDETGTVCCSSCPCPTIPICGGSSTC